MSGPRSRRQDERAALVGPLVGLHAGGAALVGQDGLDLDPQADIGTSAAGTVGVGGDDLNRLDIAGLALERRQLVLRQVRVGVDLGQLLGRAQAYVNAKPAM